LSSDLNADDERHLLSGAYVLDALGTEERLAYEQHLAGCHSCQAEVAELRGAASQLGVAVAEQPPSSLRARVLAEVDRTPQEQPVAAPAPPAPVGPPAPVADLDERRARRTARIFQAAAAVLAVLALAVTAWGVSAHRDASDARQQAAAVQAVVAAPDAEVIHGGGQGGVSANLVVSPSLGQSAFVADGLAAPPSGKAYQLWYIDSSGAARSAGLVEASDGKSTQLLRGTIDGATTVGMTLEPSGGSPQPTTKPILAIPLV
jgi:anti-sigma-K factor RskA